jgi:hypothetical protein
LEQEGQADLIALRIMDNLALSNTFTIEKYRAVLKVIQDKSSTAQTPIAKRPVFLAFDVPSV